MLTKEKIISIAICDPTILKIWWAKKPIIINMASCFPHHWRGHLMSSGSTCWRLKINNSLVTKSFDGSLMDVVYWKISILKSSSHVWFIHPTDFVIGCKWWWHFKSIGYKVLLSYSSIILTPSSYPTKEDIRRMLLNLRFNIKDNMLWILFFQFFFKEKKKIQNTTNFSFWCWKHTKII